MNALLAHPEYIHSLLVRMYISYLLLSSTEQAECLL